MEICSDGRMDGVVFKLVLAFSSSWYHDRTYKEKYRG
jgi:hypothetical protein